MILIKLSNNNNLSNLVHSLANLKRVKLRIAVMVITIIAIIITIMVTIIIMRWISLMITFSKQKIYKSIIKWFLNLIIYQFRAIFSPINNNSNINNNSIISNNNNINIRNFKIITNILHLIKHNITTHLANTANFLQHIIPNLWEIINHNKIIKQSKWILLIKMKKKSKD